MAEATMGAASAMLAVEAVAPAPSVAGAMQPPPAASSALADTEQAFTFTGSGAEYFRIWVVNLLLTIVTLGIYSAWAKVRRLQYFYRNTRIKGDVFDYHGNPQAILKGRILALALLGAYKIAYDFSILAAMAIGVLLVAIMPWLLSRAFRFKLANSSYRGLRFRFQGTVAQAYRMLILFPVILAFTALFAWSLLTSFSQRSSFMLVILAVIVPLLVFGGTVPLAHYLLKRYQHDNAYFGQSPFFFQARAVDFFKIYAKAIGMLVLGMVAVGIFRSLTSGMYRFLAATPFGWLFEFLFGMVGAYVMYLFVRPYLESRIQNLVWNHTELADHRFQSTAGARELLWIHASNLALIIVTLGLYKPFAAVRLVQYRVAHLALLPSGDFDEFLSDQSADDAGAAGQEAAEFFDIDIAL